MNTSLLASDTLTGLSAARSLPASETETSSVPATSPTEDFGDYTDPMAAYNDIIAKQKQSASPQNTTGTPIPPVVDQIKLSPSFEYMVVTQTENLAKRLETSLESLNINSNSMVLSVKGGVIEASGPNAKEVEQLFRDDPELGKAVRDVMALNNLLTLQKLNKQRMDEMREARTNQEKNAVDKRYSSGLINTQNMASMMAYNGEQITQVGAIDYTDLIKASLEQNKSTPKNDNTRTDTTATDALLNAAV